MMKVLRLLAAILALAWPFAALAEGTQGQTIPGYWTMNPQPNCPLGPCFVAYLAPIAPFVAGPAAISLTLGTKLSLVDAYLTCTASCYLFIYNSLTDPGNGSTTAGTAAGNLQDCVGPGTSFALNYLGNAYEAFSTGITIVVSSTGCASETQSNVGYIHARAQ